MVNTVYKRIVSLGLAVFMITAAGSYTSLDAASASKGKAKKSAAALEKEKALAHPYPSDFGPDSVDIKSYPKNVQAGYKVLTVKCAQCHSPSRPLNHRFVELEYKGKEKGKKGKAAKKANVAKLKKNKPHLFKDRTVWQIEGGVWKRYVKRMMAKPGCNITRKEGKKIWEFLVYDGNRRKLGKNEGKWKKFRKKLVSDFEKDHPKRYEELKKQKSL